MPQSQSSKLSPAAVIGPGRVGLALAIFLDRIGIEVTVGARSERGRERVEGAGLAVADPIEATRGAALVLLSVVFLLGLATYGRLVQINSEDVAITRAMNRLRYAYLVMAPDLRPYFSTGHHDDERGIATTHLLGMGSHLQTWQHFLVTTPTIVATVDAAVATAMVVLAGLTVEAPTGAVVAAGVVAFLVIWGALFLLQRLNLGVLRDTSARFPTPPDEP